MPDEKQQFARLKRNAEELNQTPVQARAVAVEARERPERVRVRRQAIRVSVDKVGVVSRGVPLQVLGAQVELDGDCEDEEEVLDKRFSKGSVLNICLDYLYRSVLKECQSQTIVANERICLQNPFSVPFFCICMRLKVVHPPRFGSGAFASVAGQGKVSALPHHDGAAAVAPPPSKLSSP